MSTVHKNKIPFTLDEQLKQHVKYWNGGDMDVLLASFRIGDYFFANKFKAALPLLKPGLRIEPSMLVVDDFMEAYEKMYKEIEEIGQTGFWVAEPFTAIPWMEAILGCTVYGGNHSFVSEPALDPDEYHPCIENLEDNSWYQKYMEFTRKLVEISNGRFPVGQPIMRGPSDMMGALLGQTRLIYEMSDNPEKMEDLAGIVTNTFIKVIKNQIEIIPSFYGGHSIGFYHLWAPGRCIWFQEDLSALLSPQWYREFIMNRDIEICKTYEYSAIHLHPASFHILKDLLGIEELKAIEINKDVGGPSIKNMLPVFTQILDSGKRLMVWGALDVADIEFIKRNFSGRPVFLNIVAESLDRAKELNLVICR